VQASSYTRRSFVYRRLEAAGARFAGVAGAAVAMQFGDQYSEIQMSRSLGLADLSPLPRIGFKGAGTMDWLTDNGVVIDGSKPNWSWRQNDGALAITRSNTEALILGDLSTAGDLCDRLESESDRAMEARAYGLPRYDGLFWFALTGSDAVACMAKVCGVDLRPALFADGAVAQTSVARLTAIVARADIGDTNVLHLLGDSASAEYFWDAMIDAMHEFGGGPVGLLSLQALQAEFK
jgi:sarcosine oxidase subunit gamma